MIIFIIIVIIFMIVNVGQKEKCGDDSFHCTVSGACVQVNSTISISISSSINHFDHLSQLGCWRLQILISNFLILKIIIITNDQNHVPLKKITFRRKSYAIMPMIVVTLVMRWRNSILCMLWIILKIIWITLDILSIILNIIMNYYITCISEYDIQSG